MGEKTLRSTERIAARRSARKGERGKRKGEEAFFLDRRRESLGGEKSSGEQTVPTRINRSGSRKGHGFSEGIKSLKRRYEAEEVS